MVVSDRTANVTPKGSHNTCVASGNDDKTRQQTDHRHSTSARTKLKRQHKGAASSQKIPSDQSPVCADAERQPTRRVDGNGQHGASAAMRIENNKSPWRRKGDLLVPMHGFEALPVMCAPQADAPVIAPTQHVRVAEELERIHAAGVLVNVAQVAAVLHIEDSVPAPA
jgi:hypothetical protein